MASLSDADKERARYHLGYLASSFAASLQFGLPRPQQTMFMVENALADLSNPYAVNRVVCILDDLDRIEQRMKLSLDQLGVDTLDKLKLRANLPDLLEREYKRWAGRLADVLGVPFYAFSQRFRNTGPGMIPRRG